MQKSILNRKTFTSGKWLLVLLIAIASAACRTNGAAAPIVGDVAADQIKIEIANDGLYQISIHDLKDAGMALEDMADTALSLTQGETAVPYHIQNDAFIFYGQAPDNRYTAVRPYILTVGETGVMMAEMGIAANNGPTLSHIPQTLRLEENHLYLSQARQDEHSDVWFWQRVGQDQKITLTLDLPTVHDSTATLRLHLLGKTVNYEVELDHDFDLILNGQNIGVVQWDGETLHTSETPLPAGLLKPGPNELVLDNEAPGASSLDIMELNWVELNYAAPATAVNDRLQFSQTDATVALDGFSDAPLIFDIANPGAPQLLTGWQYENGQAQIAVTSDMRIAASGPRGFQKPARIAPLRQSDWHSADNQADLLIITTDELAPALAPLVAAREADGLTVSLIPIAEIYDEFGYGEASPTHIQTFVAYAYENWQEPPPHYLFLVGDATTDYHNNLGHAPRNHVPSLLVPVEFSGETVSDSRLTDVDGDMQPDLAVGRWPVDSIQDVAGLVERTLAYEGGTAVNRALFATDGTETQFAAIANRLSGDSGLTAESTLLLDGAQASEVAEEWNNGAWLTTYIGHGSVERWGKENVFSNDAVGELKIDTPSIVLQLTCLTGLFAHPELTSLSETMLLHEQGPVLLIAATSLTLSSHQEPFALSLIQNAQNAANMRMGDAFLQAKQALAIENNNGLREISDTFVLLGDPSARIIRPGP